MNVLAVNVGSTSLKYAVFGPADEILCRGTAARVASAGAVLVHDEGGQKAEHPLPRPGLEAALDAMVEAVGARFPDVAAAAFKVVHGGEVSGTVFIDEEAIAAMKRFARAAPAHNPPYLLAIQHLASTLPGVPLVGSFETAFHAGWAAEARAYALPRGWEDAYGLRRYGFHGASHRYVAERMAAREAKARRVVSCHLGGSSSVCAIRDGRSVDATMGFSPQSGLPQAERVGDLDAYALVHLAAHGVGLAEAAEALATEGGLLGLSGLSGDLQELEAAEESGHEGAAFALRVYAYNARKAVGALAAAMGGVDAIVFTGGMGENSAKLRRRICDGLGFLGVALDSMRNVRVQGENRISPAGAKVAAWVIPTDEERILVREARALLASARRPVEGSVDQARAPGP